MLLFGTEPHHMFDAGAIVPAAVEDDDFARGWEMSHVSLNIQLRLFAIGWGGQGSDAEYPGADAFCNRLDRAAFPGRISALENNDNPQAFGFYPLLQSA